MTAPPPFPRSPRFYAGLLLGLAGVLVVAWAVAEFVLHMRQPKRATPLPHEVYAWPRQWNEEARTRVRESAAWTSACHVLAAEIGLEKGGLTHTRLTPDWQAVAASGRQAGAVLRLRPSLAGADWDPQSVAQVADFAESVSQEAKAAGLGGLAGIQLDYDCPASALAGYTRLVRGLKARLTNFPITVMALPSWLGEADFPPLAAESPGYVLQVHLPLRPHPGGRLGSLVDPAAAAAAVDAAVKLGIPFRVALPTWSCVAEFDDTGALRQLYAGDLPAGVRLREGSHIPLDADAWQMEELVAGWRNEASPLLQSVVWDRLPAAGDSLSWPPETLEKLCRGVRLGRGWHAEARLSPAGDRDIILRQTGDAPEDLPRELELRWSGSAIPLAVDGLRGYDAYSAGDGWARLRLLQPYSRLRVPPGTSLTVGWLRMEPDSAPVRVLLNPPGP